MRHRLSQILHYLGSKLQAFFEFVKFVFVPRKKYFMVLTSLVLVVSIFFIGKSVRADFIDSVMNLVNYLLYLFAWCLGFIAMKIFALVVAVCQYNSFVTAPAVTKAWVLVRDVCNMGFVVILLIIAFAQILNVQKYSIKALLPKVLLTAVLINFSKLLCGLMIDVAQVAMMTFVNGFQATAGANLVNGLGLTKLLQMSEEHSQGTAKANAPTASQVTLALILAIFLLIAMCFVMFFIAVLLVMRIVTIWFLVIVSPAAWAFGMLPMGSGKYNEWWQKFGWTVAVGPFMAFFLWISLLVMSNPGEMLGNMNQINADIEKKGGNVPLVGTLDNLAQAAMGLALLMASLVAAQEAGGAMASVASKGQAAAKWGMQKFTGVQAVKERGVAVGKGFMERQEAKKQAQMDWWKRGGAKAFAVKEKGVLGVKKGVAMSTSAVKGAIGGAAGRRGSDAARAAGGGLAGFRARLGAGMQNAAEKAAATKKYGRFGTINQVMAHETNQSLHEAKNKEAKAALAAKGIESTEDMRAMVQSGQGSKTERKQALLALSERGQLDRAMAEQGKAMMSGDKASEDAFDANMKKKQANLAYNLTPQRDAAGNIPPEEATRLAAEQARFNRDVQTGAIDLKSQDVSAYEDVDFMAAAHTALGSKAFSADMKKVAEKSDRHKQAISNTMQSPAFAGQVIAPLQADVVATQAALTAATAAATAAPADPAAQQALAEARAAESRARASLNGVTKAMAAITDDLEQAFARRNPDGSIQTDAAGNRMLNNEALGQHVASLSVKDLAKLNITPAISGAVARNMSAQDLNNLAKSGEEGSKRKVKQIFDSMQSFVNTPSADPATIAEQERVLQQLQGIANQSEAKGALSRDDLAAVDDTRAAYETRHPPQPTREDEIQRMSSAKGLMNIRVDATNRVQVAQTITVGQLGKLASSEEPGAGAKLNEVVNHMADVLSSRSVSGTDADALRSKLDALLARADIADNLQDRIRENVRSAVRPRIIT